jgi:hypothetical protein
MPTFPGARPAAFFLGIFSDTLPRLTPVDRVHQARHWEVTLCVLAKKRTHMSRWGLRCSKNETGHYKSRGQHCGDIELAGYLANAAGPVPLVLDLLIAHDR